MDRKTPSDHLHLIGYYRKMLEPRLSCKILFSDNVPKTINGRIEKAIRFDTNWRMGNLFFGMCNFPATFQAMMDKIFKKKIKENLIIVYIDDILAFSKTINGLKKIEKIILKKAQKYNLYFKAKKCEFRKPKIEYLGLVVEEGELAMDPAKLKRILDWPAPKTVKELQSFIEFGNFYHCFVKGFSHLTHPLHDLLKKDKKFVWTEECQESFDQLKK
jgi:hypothetical protein